MVELVGSDGQLS